MKILFNCHTPSMLAHGGLQIQIEQTEAALRRIGVDVEPLRWWDENQACDVIHHFGRVPYYAIEIAQNKGIKIVISDLLGELASRPAYKLWLQKILIRTLCRWLSPVRLSGLAWRNYQRADASIALNPSEAQIITDLYGAPPDRVHVVPNGVEDIFFQSKPTERGPWLVCTATIRDLKRNLEVAEAAVEARTPIWFIGKPYSSIDPYGQRFIAFAKENLEFVRYEGAISDRAAMARIYREARGFVLLSFYESLSLSALEAAACECPLLLTDLPWARSVFKEAASYCPRAGRAETAAALRRFYDAAPTHPRAARPLTWNEVAQQLARLYRSLLPPRA